MLRRNLLAAAAASVLPTKAIGGWCGTYWDGDGWVRRWCGLPSYVPHWPAGTVQAHAQESLALSMYQPLPASTIAVSGLNDPWFKPT